MKTAVKVKVGIIVIAAIVVGIALTCFGGGFGEPKFGTLGTNVWTAVYTNNTGQRLSIGSAFLSGLFPVGNVSTISFCNTPAQTNILVQDSSTNTLAWVANEAVLLQTNGRVLFHRTMTNTTGQWSLYLKADQ